MAKALICVKGCHAEPAGMRVDFSLEILRDNNTIEVLDSVDAVAGFSASTTQIASAIKNSAIGHAASLGIQIGQVDVIIFGGPA